jgi:hypothetical protein
MLNKGDGNDQRGVAFSIDFNDFKSFLLFISRQLLLKIALHMLQDIGILHRSGRDARCKEISYLLFKLLIYNSPNVTPKEHIERR